MRARGFSMSCFFRRLTTIVSALSLALNPVLASAAPQGGAVAGGSATINQAGNTTTIQQTTSRAVINWQGFDIGAGEAVNFQQPSSSAIALNRLTSGGASQIHGSLTANGNVWIVNPQGVMFGAGAQVNVGGLVATSAGISNADFMNGNDNFSIPGSPDAKIVNEGTITVAQAGLVGLVAPSVANSGVIRATLGRVQLASADTFAVDLYGDGLISLQASEALVRQAIANSGLIEGGQVLLSVAAAQETLSSVINLEGIVSAENITIDGDAVVLTGELNATETISIEGRSVMQQGDIAASDIAVAATQAYLDNESSTVTATDGGTIHIDGGERIFASGSYEASGDEGGDITFEAADSVKLYAARVNASGITIGGRIRVGGGYQGRDATMRNARETVINPTTVLDASATGSGDGGSVIAWSEELTRFAGTALAKGGATGGDGGLIELSSKDTLDIGQYSVTDASAPHGNAGTLLLDPKNITISNSGITSGAVSYFEFVDPNADTGSFGTSVTTLASGNVVIADTGDDAAASNAGAVYLFNGATGGLISTITGSTASDAVGSVTALTNGNFVIRSGWTNGGATNAGAVTWASGTTGISGVVSAANSLVGSTINDGVGFGTVVVLPSGNYVVRSTNWDNGAVDQAGAVTWGNGLGGTVGAISAANSLVGSTAFDHVGNGSVTILSNGNYVVASDDWDNGGATNAGAVTWCDGSAGCTGAVSSANSLVGSTANDEVGIDGVVALTNGNYVASSSNWDNGGAANAGAVTWCNGTTGCTGTVSAANSLVGSVANDDVGNGSATALTNGNYVVRSVGWANGGSDNAGAVTWGNGTTGIVGAVSAANSLVGSTASDAVGHDDLIALSNGNYVVVSASWDNGGAADAGAVTWGNGAGGTVGVVSAANSLVGTTALDFVGIDGIEELANGNYVVISPAWDNGGAGDAEAVTWGNGLGGTVGAVSAANSLVGSTTFDAIGDTGIQLLSNGNYVVRSRFWNNGAVAFAGAVTWGNGSGGTVGVVSAANSLVGSTANDQVGNGFVTELTNGHYVVRSIGWDNGGTADAGAVTWGNGAGGTVGVVSAANSLIGSTANDQVGSDGILPLTNGNYVVRSPLWDNGGTANVGAVTWGNGLGGTVGVVSAANSLVGSTLNDGVGSNSVAALTNGNYVVSSSGWDNGGIVNAGAVTWGNGLGGTVGAVSAANSLVGSTLNDNVGGNGVTALTNGNYIVRSQNWDNGGDVNAGAATLCAGTGGCIGAVTSHNSIIGPQGAAGLNTFVADAVNGRTIVRFTTAQRIYSVSNDFLTPSAYNFAYTPTGDVNLHPSFITAVLNAGTNVTLQANNDITVTDAVTANNPGGNGGAFTLQAGRSILLNANITTDSGNLNLYANDLLANGVVDAQRDAGDAVITMANGTSINAGTGAVTIEVRAGTGLTNNGAGNLTLEDITAASIFARAFRNTSDLVLGGILTASGAGTAITLVAGDDFINNTGAGALDASAGRWLVYSANPADDTIGSLANDFRRFSCAYGGACPAMPGGDDGLLYSFTPSLTITPTGGISLTAGDPVPNLVAYAYGIAGYLGADAGDDALGGAVNGTTDYTTNSTAGTYGISYAAGALTSAMGYGFTYADNLAAITVSAAAAASDSAEWTDRENQQDPAKTGLIEAVPCAMSASGKQEAKTLCLVTDGMIDMERI
jgi:filamentous hemagglutinin family protein